MTGPAGADIARLVADMLRWRRGGDPDPLDVPVALEVLRRLADGDRVARAELVALAAEAGGATGDPDAEARADRVAALAELDDAGRIAGLHGLTVEPTAYTLVLPSGRRGTWCALDTLFLPPLLGRDARVEGPCAVTGTPVSLQVTAAGAVAAAEPATLALTVPVPDPSAPPRSNAELRATFCARSRFAIDAAAAERFAAEGDGDVAVLELKSAAQVGRGIAEGLGSLPGG